MCGRLQATCHRRKVQRQLWKILAAFWQHLNQFSVTQVCNHYSDIQATGGFGRCCSYHKLRKLQFCEGTQNSSKSLNLQMLELDLGSVLRRWINELFKSGNKVTGRSNLSKTQIRLLLDLNRQHLLLSSWKATPITNTGMLQQKYCKTRNASSTCRVVPVGSFWTTRSSL